MVRLQITGHVTLGKNLAAVARAVTRPPLTAVLTRAAEPVRQRMGDLAPRSANPGRLGHLADHIVSEVVTDAEEATVAVGPAWPFWYARFDEYGTTRRPAEPFMRPAFDETKAATLTQIATDLWPLLTDAVTTSTEGAP